MNAHRVRPVRALRPVLARLGGWPRRLLAAALLLAALAAELSHPSHASGPAPPERPVTVLAAARDLPAGSVLRPADVRTLRLPPAAVPAGALRGSAAVAGRLVAGPVRRGETLTDVRLVGPGLAADLASDLAGSGSVAVPVRLADPATAVLLRPGSHVDVLATGSAADRSDADPAAGSAPAGAGPQGSDPSGVAPGTGTGTGHGAAAPGGQPAIVLASDVTVLAVVPVDADGVEGPLLVVGASPAVARRLAGAQARDGTGLAVTLRPP